MFTLTIIFAIALVAVTITAVCLDYYYRKKIVELKEISKGSVSYLKELLSSKKHELDKSEAHINVLKEDNSALDKSLRLVMENINHISASAPSKHSAMYAAMKLSGALKPYIRYEGGKCYINVYSGPCNIPEKD